MDCFSYKYLRIEYFVLAEYKIIKSPKTIAFRTFYAGRSGVTELSEKTSKINGLQVVNKLYLQIIGVQKWTPIILFFLII
ncbi:MAG: hypothetical protein DBY09_02730 [Selenomonadales bacterium]|nr:MAG: hypothetical protein DBY09_02730 [Selenomonadales bacterium]